MPAVRVKTGPDKGAADRLKDRDQWSVKKQSDGNCSDDQFDQPSECLQADKHTVQLHEGGVGENQGQGPDKPDGNR
jgi:hypothetical protein